MGYSHYWKFKGKVAPKDIKGGTEKFKNAVALLKECLDACNGKTRYPNWGDNRFETEVPMVLAGGNGLGEPTITDTKVIFNGERKGGKSCETFAICIDRDGSDCCKTAREPYDTAVCLALLSFKKAFGEDFEYSSDGGETEWEYAKSVFREVV